VRAPLGARSGIRACQNNGCGLYLEPARIKRGGEGHSLVTYGPRSQGDFLRWLYRQRRLTPAELTDRLHALDNLASGKLRPAIAPLANARRMGRPPINPAATRN
jgi:hypothetical protein